MTREVDRTMHVDGTQLVSLLGAVLILVAYAGGQVGRLDSKGTAYSALNLVGSGLLTYVAIVGFQLGFIVLEGIWALVSLLALIRRRS